MNRSLVLYAQSLFSDERHLSPSSLVLRLNKLDGWMNVNKESEHVENKDEVELKTSCELFVPSPRILLSDFKPYRSACLTFFPLDLIGSVCVLSARALKIILSTSAFL